MPKKKASLKDEHIQMPHREEVQLTVILTFSPCDNNINHIWNILFLTQSTPNTHIAYTNSKHISLALVIFRIVGIFVGCNLLCSFLTE